MSKLLAVAVSFFLVLGFALADEFFGAIKKIDGNKITVERKKKGEEAKEVTLDATGAKVSKGKFNKEAKKIETGDPLDGGLKNDAVKVGAYGSFVTDGDKAVEIRIIEKKKQQ